MYQSGFDILRLAIFVNIYNKPNPNIRPLYSPILEEKYDSGENWSPLTLFLKSDINRGSEGDLTSHFSIFYRERTDLYQNLGEKILCECSILISLSVIVPHRPQRSRSLYEKSTFCQRPNYNFEVANPIKIFMSRFLCIELLKFSCHFNNLYDGLAQKWLLLIFNSKCGVRTLRNL